jgi:hypothetical protein
VGLVRRSLLGDQRKDRIDCRCGHQGGSRDGSSNGSSNDAAGCNSQ